MGEERGTLTFFFPIWDYYTWCLNTNYLCAVWVSKGWPGYFSCAPVERDGGNRLESFDIPLVCVLHSWRKGVLHASCGVSGCQWRMVPADWKLSSISSLPEEQLLCAQLWVQRRGTVGTACRCHVAEMLLGERMLRRKVVPFCEPQSISISSILFSSSSPLLFLRAVSSTQHFSVTVMYLRPSYVPGIIPLIKAELFITCVIIRWIA